MKLLPFCSMIVICHFNIYLIMTEGTNTNSLLHLPFLVIRDVVLANAHRF